MLHLHRSHRIEHLAEALASALAQPTDDPFRPDWVVVHGRPVEQWLRGRIAQRLGVCANVRFLSPSMLVEEVIERALGVTRTTARAWRGERLMWAVLGAFEDERLVASPLAAPLLGYLGDAGTGSARAVQLARTVAEHFQRYVVWRPDLVRGWDVGESDTKDWQPVLWRIAHERLGDVEHPAQLLERVRGRITAEGLPNGLPSRVAWLAQGSVGELHLDAAATLASAGVPVHLLLPTSAHALASAVTSPEHPLLRSLGRAAAGVEAAAADLLRRRDVTVDSAPAADEPRGESVLALLQRDVVSDVPRGPLGAPRTTLAAGDRSLRVHGCHGRARQADVLRDELLGLFDANAGLMPRDVLVLTPDVTGFAPLLSAAFAGTPGEAPDAPPVIPLRVADRPLRVENAVMEAALRLLDLAHGRVDAAALLDFIGLPAVRARFDIDDEGHERLRRWTRESGVRWGVDAKHRASFGVPDDREYTWRFGLERMLLGWTLPGETLFGGALPYDEIEGKEAELLGRLAEAFDRTRVATDSLVPLEWERGSRPVQRRIGEWCDRLSAALGTLVGGRSVQVERLAFDAALRNLRESANGADLPIDAPAFRLLLDARFAEPAEAQHDGAGAVTLASLAVGRVRPARVVCLLGMDDGAFPRGRRAAGFDRLAEHARPGDLDPNAEDRQCFLDAVLAARECLVITYAGRTCDTNEHVAPAVPVSELLDALDATFAGPPGADGGPTSARALVEVEHPLQPFSPRNFGAPALSHDLVQLAGARALQGERRQPPAFLTRELPAPGREGDVVWLDDLARFFVNPARALLAERLGVREVGEGIVETREPPLLDGLSYYQVRQSLLRRMLGGPTVPALGVAELRAAGRLPRAGLGELAFDAAHDAALRIAETAAARMGGATAEPLALDRTVGRWRLVGRFGLRDADGGLLEIQANTPRAKAIVPLWVRHVALQFALGRGVTSRLIGMAHEDHCPGGVCELAPMPDSEGVILALLELYDRGRRRPIPFFPETSREYVDALKNADPASDRAAHLAAVRAARAKFDPSFVAVPPESADEHVRRVFRDPTAALADPQFSDAALTVWRPLSACLSTPAA